MIIGVGSISAPILQMCWSEALLAEDVYPADKLIGVRKNGASLIVPIPTWPADVSLCPLAADFQQQTFLLLSAKS